MSQTYGSESAYVIIKVSYFSLVEKECFLMYRMDSIILWLESKDFL